RRAAAPPREYLFRIVSIGLVLFGTRPVRLFRWALASASRPQGRRSWSQSSYSYPCRALRPCAITSSLRRAAALPREYLFRIVSIGSVLFGTRPVRLFRWALASARATSWFQSSYSYPWRALRLCEIISSLRCAAASCETIF